MRTELKTRRADLLTITPRKDQGLHGVPEATSANTELFGTSRMIDALHSKPDAKPKDILSIVRASVDEFVGNAEQSDDLTMACVEYRG